MKAINTVLTEAYRKHCRAEREWLKAIEKELTQGVSVTWMHGRYRQIGTVIRSAHDRVLVSNFRTDKEVWVHVPRIEQVRGEED